MQAIQTYCLHMTEKRGQRIVAKAARRIVLPWDHNITDQENHEKAAREYAARIWSDKKIKFATGGFEDGTQVWVALEKGRRK